MSNFGVNSRHYLLAMLLLSCTGCAAQWCHLPDDCAYVFSQTQLGWELSDICNNCPLDGCVCGAGVECGCGVRVDDAVWIDGAQPEPVSHRPRIAVGPPPVPYEPPMPPKFLPVPVRSVW